MNGNIRNTVWCGVLAMGICLIASGSAWASAWGSSWGAVNGIVAPSGPDDQIVWNDNASLWLLHTEAEVYHMHPPLTHAHDTDSELWDPGGDGTAQLGTIMTGDLVRVSGVEATIASGQNPPAVNIDQMFTFDQQTYGTVFSFAHDIPNSYSDAAGLGQHDNLFWITYDGLGDPPTSTTQVGFTLSGAWNLEGNSDPDDNWWADWSAYAEIYDMGLNVLGNGSQYHRLDGPGYKGDSGSVDIQFTVQLEYDTQYALRFWLDAESHAQAIPEPVTLALLALGSLGLVRKSKL